MTHTIKQLEYWLKSDEKEAKEWRDRTPLIEWSHLEAELIQLQEQKTQAERDAKTAVWVEARRPAKEAKEAREAVLQAEREKLTNELIAKGQAELEANIDPLVLEKRRRAVRTF